MFKFFAKTLTKNLWIKIFCLFAATVLWIYIAAGQNTVGKYPGSIKIKAINTPSGLIAIYDVKTVDIKIMAEPSIWSKLSGDSFSAFVDLSSQQEGTYELPVNIVSSVAGVSVVEKSPEKIIVSLETIVTKEVPINKKVEGSAGEGLVAGNVDITPGAVTVRGPKSIVNNISEGSILVRLNGESDKFTKNFQVVAFDEQGEAIDNVEFDPAEVLATVAIVKASNNKTVGVRVKTSGVPKTGYYVSNISVAPSTIDITGPASLLSDLTYIETLPVDLTNQSSDLEKDVGLSIKNGLALQAGSPSKVHVKISFLRNEVTKEISATIEPTGLGAYKISTISPSEVKVLCTGPSDAIGGLESSDVVLTLDFSDKRPSNGSINFNISPTSFKTPEGISVISAVPSSLAVTISNK